MHSAVTREQCCSRLEQLCLGGASEVYLFLFPEYHAVSLLQAAPKALSLLPSSVSRQIACSLHWIGLFHTWARSALGFDGRWSSAASGISWRLNAAAGVNS